MRYFPQKLFLISIFISLFTVPIRTHAALQFVGFASSTGNSANYTVSLTSLTGGSGSAALAGDLVIISTGWVSTANGNPGVNTAGFTETSDLYASDSDDSNLSVNWKIMEGVPDTTVTCLGNGTATNGSTCLAHVWRNVANDSPMDVTDVEAVPGNNIGTSTPNAGAITPITAGAIVIATGLGADAAADVSVTAPSGYGNHVQASVDPGLASIHAMASKAWSGSGAEDPAVWTGWTSTAAGSWTAVTLALRPASSTIVITNPESNVTQTSVTINGNITSTGGATSTVRGFAWGTVATLIGGDTATTTENGSFGAGEFTGSLSNLTCNTTYYARAYATNSQGTSFGSIDQIVTSPCKPTVTTQSASSITVTGATLNGTITATGGENATIRGFAWGTEATLIGGDTATTTEEGSFGTGAFTDSSLTLTCNTTYYSRAYAVNSAGTSTGAVSSSFTTSACLTAPTVTTQSASSVTASGATLNGNITATGGANATIRGFAWGTTVTLVGGDTATTTEEGSFGTGAFTNSALTLVCNTTYYSRAYAVNSVGTSTGAISASFTTSPCKPTVTTQSASSITETGATLNGTITATGGENATIRGFAWGTEATLIGGDTATTTELGSFSTGAFTNSALTLTCNTTYYSRAYAVNSAGTSTGAVSASFTTSPCGPTVTTQSASSVTSTGATLNGNITATGGANATIRGFAWGTDPTLIGGDTATTTELGSFGAGAFTNSTITFICNTTYYSRAYAVNPAGTSTGAVSASFTTSACLTAPTVTTQSASSITATGATLNGTITATGGENATIRGFAWGTEATLIGGDTATTTELGSFSTGAFTNSSITFIGNTVYYSRAYAVNSVGTSTGAISGAFMTLPDVPGTPTASDTTATTLTLNWTAPAGGASTYKVEKCTGSGCSDFSEITAGVATLSYGVTGLSPSVTYRFRVRATNGVGDGAYATSADITTSATATTELSAYRFFDAAASYTPGTALAIQNTSATLVGTGDSFRLRMLIHFGTSNVAINERAFKLQFAAKSGTCDTSFVGETYADVTGATAISYKDSAGVSDNNALGVASDLTHGGDAVVNQSYEEGNNFTNSQSTISSGQDGKWDFSLYDNGATAGQSYCLRVVQSDGSILSSYSQIPEISMMSLGTPALEQVHYRWRNDNGSESTATFDGVEDVELSSSVFIGDRKRLRISLANTGSGTATDYNYRLEYATTSCTVWTPTASYGNLTTEHWGMDITSNAQDGSATTNSAGLTDPAGPTFFAGLFQSYQNQTASLSLPNNRFTEFEYSIRSTASALTETSYCFRLTNAGSIANFTYSLLPRIVIRAPIFRPSGGGGGNAGGESSGTPGTPQGGGSIGGGGNAGGETGGTPGGTTGGGGAGGGGNSE